MNNYAGQALIQFIVVSAPWWGAFLMSFVAALVLVPLVREMNRKFGMVDQPSARRINKTPIPRGGGLGVFLALAFSLSLFPLISNRPLVSGPQGLSALLHWLPIVILVMVGYADDKFGLSPFVKLAGQVLAACVAVFFCHLGFSAVCPGLPHWLDAAFTVFWLVGAVNAFNLIDGLDGLAAGLAAIAVVGMAGALFCVGLADSTFLHFAFLGALLGFLRYNFNPASVFLGDCGSMFIGYMVAALPLMTKSSNSFLVGVGVPLLAMGVPIFDTALAILRRTVRALLRREEPGREQGNDRVMTADTDHLHHRILRRFVSQRKAALVLYAFAALLVAIGVGGVLLRGRAVALFIVGFMVVAYIIFRDMRRIELWDAGRLLNAAAHASALARRRRRHVMAVPVLIVMDLSVLCVAWLLTSAILGLPVNEAAIHRWMVLRVVPMFLALVVFRAYQTIWARALLSNYVRLGGAVVCGSALTCAMAILGGVPSSHMTAFTVMYAASVFSGLLAVRSLRPAIRDLFYALDAGRLAETQEASRVMVYGAGLRYQAYRRELVRASSSGNRVIVGLLDDDVLLRNQYIGGIKVYGTLEQAPSIFKALRVDEVVVAAKLTPERRDVARKMFAICGVKATQFTFVEETL